MHRAALVATEVQAICLQLVQLADVHGIGIIGALGYVDDLVAGHVGTLVESCRVVHHQRAVQRCAARHCQRTTDIHRSRGGQRRGLHVREHRVICHLHLNLASRLIGKRLHVLGRVRSGYCGISRQACRHLSRRANDGQRATQILVHDIGAGGISEVQASRDQLVGRRIQLAAVDGIGAGGTDFTRSDVLDAALLAGCANRHHTHAGLTGKAAVGDALHRGRIHGPGQAPCRGGASRIGTGKVGRTYAAGRTGRAVVTQIDRVLGRLAVGNGCRASSSRVIDVAAKNICVAEVDNVIVAQDERVRCRTGDRVVIADPVAAVSVDVGRVADGTGVVASDHVTRANADRLVAQRLRALANGDRIDVAASGACHGHGAQGD